MELYQVHPEGNQIQAAAQEEIWNVGNIRLRQCSQAPPNLGCNCFFDSMAAGSVHTHSKIESLLFMLEIDLNK